MPAGGLADLTVIARVGVVDAVAWDCGAFLEGGWVDGVRGLWGGDGFVVVGRGGSVVVGEVGVDVVEVMFRLRICSREGGSSEQEQEEEEGGAGEVHAECKAGLVEMDFFTLIPPKKTRKYNYSGSWSRNSRNSTRQRATHVVKHALRQ